MLFVAVLVAVAFSRRRRHRFLPVLILHHHNCTLVVVGGGGAAVAGAAVSCLNGKSYQSLLIENIFIGIADDVIVICS